MSSLDFAQLRAYFRFPFKDHESRNNLLIGAALLVGASIVPIIPMIPAVGYLYRVMRRTIDGEGPSMPPWQDWGRLFLDGLKLIVISFIFLLPGTIAGLGGFLAYFLSIFGLSLGGDNPDPGALGFFFFGMLLLFVGMMLGILLQLLGGLPLPMAAAHAIAKDRISAAFHFGRWNRVIRNRLVDFTIGWVILFGLFGLLYILYMLMYLTIVLCLAIPLVLPAFSFYALLVGATIFAEIYRQSAQELGEEIIPEGQLDTPVTTSTPAAPSPEVVVPLKTEPERGETTSEETRIENSVDPGPDADIDPNRTHLLPPLEDWPDEDPDPNRTFRISPDE